MDLRTKMVLLALLGFLFFTPTKLVAQCPTANGNFIEEMGVEPFDYKVPIADFDTILSLFNDELGKQVGAEIGGFVFVPVRMKIPSSDGGPATETDTIPFISRGMRVYLAYYRIDSNTGGRTIAMYRYDADAMQPCTNAPLYRPGVITLPAMANNFLPHPRNTRIEDNDIVAFQQGPPMDLSYLSYDDYLYLKSNSFYPSGADPSWPTHLSIKRAMSDQMFDLVNQTHYGMQKYRTLSFQPYPYSSLGPNQEAVMAFKYGYYCPPYWTGDPPPSESLSQPVNRQLQADLSLDMKGPEGKQFVASNPIIKIPTEEQVNQILGAFIESQIITREVIVADIAKKASFWKKYRLIILPILMLVLGLMAGKFIFN